jgi:PAS domain S-box-containing protein
MKNEQGDDFDLNEIFADYFISEFENPIDAYTGTMGNSAGGIVSMAGTPHTLAAATGAETLPTGGIRTAFHTAAAAAAAGVATTGQAAHFQHAAKRAKLEANAGVPYAHPGGLTSRLGVPMPLLQGQNGAHTVAAQLVANPAASGVSLPVGVGIRLGGAGGVAPTTAQTAARAGGAGFLWGGAQMAGMSDQAIAERRQRNREHAKRSRVRKKFMLESLQEQVSSLQLENQRLRTLIQDNIPEHAQKIISESCSKNSLFGDKASGESQEKKSIALVRSDFQLMESLTSGQQNFVLSDPRLPDNPIVFATPGFYKLTGYTQEQVLGRNCRFLQGPGTNPKTVDIIRKAIATGSDCTVCILNYKADGTPFWNQFFVAALRDSDNCIVNYVSRQR